MSNWRVQHYVGEKLVRDPRWLGLRVKSVPQWQTFHVGELEVRQALNAPLYARLYAEGYDFRIIDTLTELLAKTPVTD